MAEQSEVVRCRCGRPAEPNSLLTCCIITDLRAALLRAEARYHTDVDGAISARLEAEAREKQALAFWAEFVCGRCGRIERSGCCGLGPHFDGDYAADLGLALSDLSSTSGRLQNAATAWKDMRDFDLNASHNSTAPFVAAERRLTRALEGNSEG